MAPRQQGQAASLPSSARTGGKGEKGAAANMTATQTERDEDFLLRSLLAQGLETPIAQPVARHPATMPSRDLRYEPYHTYPTDVTLRPTRSQRRNHKIPEVAFVDGKTVDALAVRIIWFGIALLWASSTFSNIIAINRPLNGSWSFGMALTTIHPVAWIGGIAGAIYLTVIESWRLRSWGWQDSGYMAHFMIDWGMSVAGLWTLFGFVLTEWIVTAVNTG